MRLYNLGKVSWQESQLIYHALADLGHESLVLLSPSSPYVCIGYHQDAHHEVDLAFCRENSIPVFRREVGGGAVYLDGDQLFFQLIIRKDNPIVPSGRSAFYQKFLQPVINVHNRIGLKAEYKPVNDIVVETRKISGTGAGEIGECIAFVGNLILDFDYEMMSRVLRVPDEKFRGKLKESIEENLTTIRRELGDGDNPRLNEALNALVIEEFEVLIGKMDTHEIDAELTAVMEAMADRMMSETWLFRKGRQFHGRAVKIRSGISLFHRMHKAPGGLIRADFMVGDGRLVDISLSGDFFSFPENAISQIETILGGKKLSDVQNVLTGFYENHTFEIPGIGVDDWIKVLGM
jgi:lipoate-protein ligase A